MTQIDTDESTCGCPDFALSRRSFLGASAAVGGTFALTQLFGDAMLQASFAAATGGNTLVVLSLRGGIDGLGVVVPHGDPAYYQARPNTAIPATSLLCRDAMFGLHPGLAPLQKYWQAGRWLPFRQPGSRSRTAHTSRRSRRWRMRPPAPASGRAGSTGWWAWAAARTCWRPSSSADPHRRLPSPADAPVVATTDSAGCRSPASKTGGPTSATPQLRTAWNSRTVH